LARDLAKRNAARGITMSNARGLKALTAGALCVLIAASTPGATVLAKPVAPAAAEPSLADGQPSVDACGKLGFQTAEDTGEADSLVVTAQKGSGLVSKPRRDKGRGPPAPPPPAPPPPPVPMPALPAIAPAPAEAVTITGSRAPQGYVAGVPVTVVPAPNDTEKYPGGVSNPIKQVAADPVSTFSIDVDTASYSNVRRFITDGQLPPRDAVRVEELVNYFDYGYQRPTDRNEPFRAFLAVAPSPWSQGKQILHVGLQGYELPRGQQPPLNLVFLVDTSGSMWSEDKLPLAKKAMNILIDQLRPGDRVSMVAYAGSAGAVLGPTTGREKLKMRCALGALEAGGSTAGGEGLALAYALAQQNFRKDAVNRVILLTDGDFNVGVSDPSKLKDFVADKRKTGIYLSVYGFGRGNYNDTMMQILAQNGNGAAGYIDSLEEGRRLFRDDFSGSVFPIADDVKIQIEFNPAAVSEYRLIGYETRMLAREDFNNDQVDAGEVGSGASVTALYEITPKGGPASVDPLRYGGGAAAETAPAGELAFLKIRYKLPGQATSKLMQRPVTRAETVASLDQAPEATRWAVAVAGFGQTLRGDPWLSPAFGWDRIEALAQGARGKDEDGARAEFVRLVRAGKDGKRVNE
jgi:Ca-activated chloride channel family protein